MSVKSAKTRPGLITSVGFLLAAVVSTVAASPPGQEEKALIRAGSGMPTPGVGSGPSFGCPEAVVVEASGTLAIADSCLGALVRVDPVTGDRTIVSDDTTGTGPAFVPRDVAIESSGAFLVIAGPTLGRDSGVVRVDAVTGDRIMLSRFYFPSSITVEDKGTVLVGDQENDIGDETLFRVDPSSGSRTVLSGGGILSNKQGDGPRFTSIDALAVETAGTILVPSKKKLLRVDPSNGNRMIVSGPLRGIGPHFVQPLAMAVEAEGSLVLTDIQRNAVFRVDTVTGDRVIVSGPFKGRGPSLHAPSGIAVERGGALVVVNKATNAAAVIRVDPVTGDRTLLSQ